ncbi:MAG: SRPBCC family protein [Chitinophagaceae bacterium]
MAAHSFKKVQQIPVSAEKAWEFFSSPANLETITPAGMGFRIISRYHGDKMYAGQLIEYKVKPLLGIPVYWMTEITQVKEPEYFIDEQRYGPYRLWHHQHHFRQIPGGVEMTDIVHYKIPLGFIGRLINRLVVRKKLEQIFSYRFRKVEERFGRFDMEKIS